MKAKGRFVWLRNARSYSCFPEIIYRCGKAAGLTAMKFKEFQQVALAKDIPEERLRRGDLATIVDIHPRNGGEIAYSIEVFNALGETIAVTTVAESVLEELTANEWGH
jgi:hypothetical protein